MVFEFRKWGSTPRLFRDMEVTEKLDGCNACIVVQPVSMPWPFGDRVGECVIVEIDGQSSALGVQSRSRKLSPEADHYGLCAWAHENAQDIADALGHGYHYGEWWGKGIQRGYGLTEKRFSLFNTKRWGSVDLPNNIGLHVVPTLYRGPFDTATVRLMLERLRTEGSAAAPGYMRPEGVVVYHSAANALFKATLENDEKAKSAAQVIPLPVSTEPEPTPTLELIAA